MKHRILFLLCSLLTLTASAQIRDSLLRRMNAVKADTDHFLYGLCTLPEEADPAISREEARKELLEQVRLFCTGFTYFHGTEHLPADSIHYISCQLGPSCFRSLAYLSKAVLLAKENDLHLRHEDLNRQQARKHLLAGMQELDYIRDLLFFLEGQDKSDLTIISGQDIDDETQVLVNHGYLVYYDLKSGRILEIMTPMDSSDRRKNLKTGRFANPMIYRTAPLWIYIDEI